MAEGKKVLYIGDSITDGAWGNSSKWNASTEERNLQDMNHIYGHGYMMISASRLQAQAPEEGLICMNRGISGNTLSDLEARWEKDVLSHQPDIVSILIGTNDVEQALNKGEKIEPEGWGQRLRRLLDKTLQENPDTKFLLCTPFVAASGRLANSPDLDQRMKMIEAIDQVIVKISQDYAAATLVPFHSLLEETIQAHPSVSPSYWIWDGIHPTPAMHMLMADLWLEKAARYVGNSD